MNILAVTNLYPSPIQPHRAPFNRQEFRALAARHRVEVIAPVAWTDEIRALREGLPASWPRRRVDDGGVAVSHPRYVFPPRGLRRWYGEFLGASIRREFDRALERFRPDLIYAPWAYPDGLAAVRLARRAGLPAVVKVHGSDIRLVDRHPGRLPGTRLALTSADAVVAVSRDLAERVVGLGADPDRVRVVYGGIDRRLFRAGDRDEARARLGLAVPDGPIVLFVGNLVEVKGVDVLLDALARLVGEGMRPACYLIGRGPLGPEFDRQARKLGIGDRVRRLGARPLETLPDWYRAADVLALPSHSEGVPSVLLEASACGTPWVASRVGGIPEIAHLGRGRLVPPANPGLLASAIREAVEDARPRDPSPADIRTHDDVATELSRLLGEVAGRHATTPRTSGATR